MENNNNNPVATAEASLMEVRRRIHHIVHVIDPRTTSGESLLHLSVMKNNVLKSQNNMFEEGQFNFFPSVEVTRLLVECGAKINSKSLTSDTPLHAASILTNFRHEIVETLLENGAHIDARNDINQRPLELLRHVPDCKINPLNYMSLKCMAARAVVQHGLHYKNEVPAILEKFIEDH